MTPNDEPWYTARCIFHHPALRGEDGAAVYEERFVLFRAESGEEAVRMAEEEARAYGIHTAGIEYVKLIDVFHLFDDQVGAGSEVYSQMRTSHLDACEYIDRYFDTGEERSCYGSPAP